MLTNEKVGESAAAILRYSGRPFFRRKARARASTYAYILYLASLVARIKRKRAKGEAAEKMIKSGKFGELGALVTHVTAAAAASVESSPSSLYIELVRETATFAVTLTASSWILSPSLSRSCSCVRSTSYAQTRLFCQ